MVMRIALLTTLSLSLAATLGMAADVEPTACTLTDSTGYYDLRGLQRTDKDYTVRNPLNGETYSINFCGPRADQVGAYYEGPHGGISLGQYNTTPSNLNGNLAFIYRDGSVCPSTASKRGAVIYLQCESSWGSGEPTFVGSVDECTYVFTMKTSHACTVGVVASIGSAIGVFIGFIIVAAAVSFFSAVAYNRFVLHQRGMDQFPSMDRINDAVLFVKDIAVISAIWIMDLLQNLFTRLTPLISRRSSSGFSSGVDYTRGAWSRNARDGFSPLSTEAAAAPAAHLLGEDEDEEEVEEGEGEGKTHKPFKDDELV
ncbi:cation-dependent mannose-6-phosphate receptor [Pseudohyphozyma bogoriensis]|nr:cation-dependent mannose-6-phosphate receptor [Pseudohyphozyma bogoriensis]